MRTATLTLLAVASAASVGQNGTVAPVAAGQGGKPADAGKPDPEWNKDPEWFDRTQWSKNTLGPLMMSEEERKRHEFPEPPPVRGQPRPTAFPDVKPVGPKEVMAFAARWNLQVLESDPPLRKLRKARLRAARDELLDLLAFRMIGDPRVPYEATMASFLSVAREAVATGLEMSETPEDRRAWLAFRVGLEKEHEAFAADRVKGGIGQPAAAWAARRSRLDAEIALLRHDWPEAAAGAGAGKPDPEWNRAPDWGKPAGAEDVAGEPPPGPPPPGRGPLRPTAFPQIQPVDPKAAREFAARRVQSVRESDPPLVKLQKAKLRAAWECFAALSRSGYIGDPRVPIESVTAALFAASREVVAAGLEVAQQPEGRRAWLEFGVGVFKDIEAYIAGGVNAETVRPGLLWSARWHRLGAEVALMSFDGQVR